ncbi:hypothetical protein JB92DRAFT_2836154 [Gautieria morchelliformis]|nr:hypothetical protein JB92DRAFT_2836154 [Gautieria morchelliformis]
MDGFGFVEDAEQAGTKFNDNSLPIAAHTQLTYCVWVFNLSEWTRWQDLKDFGRTGGAAVAFSDIDSLDPTLGFIEYLSSEDAKRAAKLLDKTELRGNIVRVKTQQQVGTQ